MGSFPSGSVLKNLPTNAGDAGSTPGPGRSPGEGNGNPLQYPCLYNSMDRGAWWATVYSVTRVRHDWSNLALQSAWRKMTFTEHLPESRYKDWVL